MGEADILLKRLAACRNYLHSQDVGFGHDVLEGLQTGLEFISKDATPLNLVAWSHVIEEVYEALHGDDTYQKALFAYDTGDQKKLSEVLESIFPNISLTKKDKLYFGWLPIFPADAYVNQAKNFQSYFLPTTNKVEGASDDNIRPVLFSDDPIDAEGILFWEVDTRDYAVFEVEDNFAVYAPRLAPTKLCIKTEGSLSYKHEDNADAIVDYQRQIKKELGGYDYKEKGFNKFDERRISAGDVSSHEKLDLEHRLLCEFITKAKGEGKKIHLVTDEKEYDCLRESGVVFEDFYLFVDESRSRILDMSPVAAHLLDTPQGNFYAKLMLSS